MLRRGGGGCPDPLELRQGVGGRRKRGAPAREWAQRPAAARRRCSEEAAPEEVGAEGPEEGGACSEVAAPDEEDADIEDEKIKGIFLHIFMPLEGLWI